MNVCSYDNERGSHEPLLFVNTTAFGGDGSCGGAVAVPVTAPAAPSGLAATAPSSAQINVSWTDNSDDEAEFAIERRRDDEVAFAEIATVRANVTAYAEGGLAAATTYHYRVRARNTAGASDPSNVASATTPAAPVGALHVASVRYSTDGGRNSDKHLNVDVAVVDGVYVPVVGATVSMTFYRDGVAVAGGSAVTGDSGVVRFSLKNASTGCYTETGTVTHASLTWDGGWPVAQPSDPFCK